jgi:hypothetical protein
MTLWNAVLPVVQEINGNGGNFTSFHLNRSVIDLLDQAANAGESTAVTCRDRIQRVSRKARRGAMQNAFNAIFENYHEGLFYLLAKHRGIQLRRVPEVKGKTPDFSADAFDENYEIKTLDMSGGSNAYPAIAAAGRVSQKEALESAKTHGVGFGASTINPHGTAKNWLDVMQRVMRQIGANVKQGQFDEKPTTLVVALPRTSIHADADELIHVRQDASLGRVNGHLWTIAAHKIRDHFWWPHPDGSQQRGTADANDNGPLHQNGILRDYPFVQAILFISTIWKKLGSADFFNANILEEAYRLHGIWNDAFSPLGQAQSVHPSSFFDLCDAAARMGSAA